MTDTGERQSGLRLKCVELIPHLLIFGGTNGDLSTGGHFYRWLIAESGL